MKKEKEMIFYLLTSKMEEEKAEEKIIKEKIKGISIYNKEEETVYYTKIENEEELIKLKPIFEETEIKKIGIDLSKTYILLKQSGINLKGIDYDIAIASYILNPTDNKLKIDDLLAKYLEIYIEEYLGEDEENKEEQKEVQINLFETEGIKEKEEKLKEELTKEK